jgi:hypothetical protein
MNVWLGERSGPFVPSNVPYETERPGNELFWNSRTMDPTRKSGIGAARQWCIC